METRMMSEHRAAIMKLKIYRAGGIDLQILGIGVNGHIGFKRTWRRADGQNPPGFPVRGNYRRQQQIFLKKAADVPRMAITMGLGTIMKAREILPVGCRSG